MLVLRQVNLAKCSRRESLLDLKAAECVGVRWLCELGVYDIDGGRTKFGCLTQISEGRVHCGRVVGEPLAILFGGYLLACGAS